MSKCRFYFSICTMNRLLCMIFSVICIFTLSIWAYAANENNRYWELLSDEWIKILIELWIINVTDAEVKEFWLEQVKAYFWAYDNWVTTMDSFKDANMRGWLTRIAMAKMLSQYAINVLWKKPSNVVVPNFPDVTKQLDEGYNFWVTLSYQLWIMWIWIDKFRPEDPVTRAEFATALSRMLYSTPDGKPHFYSSHLDKLSEEWIITNKDPNLKELRWYVMIMLMRSDTN